MMGASMSGVTFISVPGTVGVLGAQNGSFSFMQMVLGYVVGYTIIGLVLLPLYYRLNLTSIYTYLEQRLGYWSHKTGAAFFLLSRTIGSAFRLFLVIIVLQKFMLDPWGVPFYVTVGLALLSIWIYTYQGGIRTVVWTDILQTFLMISSVIITVYYISQDMNVSVVELFTQVKDSAYSQMFFWDPLLKNYFWKQFIGGALIAIAMTGLDQDMMQKNNSCRNIREAQLNMFSFTFVQVFINLLFVSLGAMLYLYSSAKCLQIPENTDYLFPSLALHHFAPVAGMVFIIGLVAAAYSSADSALTALTTSVCVDFLGFEKESLKTEAQQIKKRQQVHVIVTIVMFITILIFRYVLDRDVVTAVFTIASYTYGPLLGLFMFGILTKRAVYDNLTPIVCVVAPIICVILNYNSKAWFGGYEFGLEMLLVNGVLTFLGLLLLSKRGLVLGQR